MHSSVLCFKAGTMYSLLGACLLWVCVYTCHLWIRRRFGSLRSDSNGMASYVGTGVIQDNIENPATERKRRSWSVVPQATKNQTFHYIFCYKSFFKSSYLIGHLSNQTKSWYISELIHSNRSGLFHNVSCFCSTATTRYTVQYSYEIYRDLYLETFHAAGLNFQMVQYITTKYYFFHIFPL